MELNDADKSLAFLLKSGDERAFKELYLSFYKAVLFFVNQYVKDLNIAEDLAQETFFYLWKNRSRLDPSKGCRSYLLSVARSKSLNYLRNIKYDKKYASVINRQNKQDEVWNDIFNRDLLYKINNEINRLPDKQKEVMILSRKKYFSNKEIAQKLQVSIKTVEYRIMTALKQIRKNIDNL